MIWKIKKIKRRIKIPTYRFRNKETLEEFDKFMHISERDPYLEANPHLVQGINGAPLIGDPIRLGITKPPESFRDVLRAAKSKHKGSTINTF